MNAELFDEKYFDITHLIQKEFDRNINKFGGKIKCRKGCSQCCSQIFRITQSDAYIIKNHISELNANEKNILKKKAEDYSVKMNSISSFGEEFFKIPKLPCPALDPNAACMIYKARPVICRRFGPPVFDYKNPDKLSACELNFQNGEEIFDDELIPNQTLIGKKWDELKTIFNKENNLSKDASTTIAEAILDS